MKSHFTAAALVVALMTAAPAIATDSAGDFVTNAAIGSQFEIDSSKLALQKSQNDQIKQFAQQMIDDHTKAGQGLKDAVDNSGAGLQVPPGLDSKHQKLIDTLNSDSGKDFDKDYVKDQVKAHKEAVNLFDSYSKKGDNDALKQFAATTLPTLQQHQQHIKQIKSAM